ncbi:PEP-CTERM sorting domain-containing protein [Congregibacter sp.]|jgi:hypothetical protein|uniref:PEP-CTERM sorting domain-containing protein n=1 Tax=Congregibacter sp. TaxID=2744308 RepID=UPI0039E5EF97
MKRILTLLVCTLGLASITSVNAGVTLNPTATLDSYISLGEFDGFSVDGWTGAGFRFFSPAQMTSTANEGVLYGDLGDSLNDPQFRLQGIQHGPVLGAGLFDIIEFRIGRLGVDSRIDVFWGTSSAGGFSGGRRTDDANLAGTVVADPFPVPLTFEVVQIDMSSLTGWSGVLSDLRIDPFSGTAVTPQDGASRVAVLDYVRIGSIGSISEVPAPATLGLMGLGFAGLGWKRRKQA